MFDARTDIPPMLTDSQMMSMSLQEVTEYMCKRKVAQRNDPAYERERIDALADFIEANLLDELADQGCIEGFCLNARAGLERGFRTWRRSRNRGVLQRQDRSGSNTITDLYYLKEQPANWAGIRFTGLMRIDLLE